MEEMTRVSATPARGASLPSSERATPVQRPLGERSGSCGNLRACDFGEKIRQLEAIGNRLRSEVDVILNDSHNRHAVRSAAAHHEERAMEDADHTAFRELTDISQEQHAIEAMKCQLENLQHRLREPRPCSGLPPLPVSVSPGARVRPSGAVERESRELRERCGWLEAQLQDCQRQMAAQADRHRCASEELKARMYELQVEHGENARLREEEQQHHADLVEKLRDTLQELQDANRDQERALLDTNTKLDAAQQNHYVLESTLSQIRGLLQSTEQRRGRPFFESDPVAKQSVSLLAHTLERYIQESECELDRRMNKLQQLDQSFEDQKRSTQLHREDLERTWKDRLHALSLEAEAKQAELRNNEAASRRRAEDLESQLRSMRDAVEEAGRRASDQSREAEQRLNAARSELESARAVWQEKRLALEAALDAAQRDTAAARMDKEQSGGQTAELQARLQEVTKQLKDAQALLDEERRGRKEDHIRLRDSQRQLNEMEQELENKRSASLALERALETLREETTLELTRVRTEGKVSYELHTRSLSERLAHSAAEKEAICAELEAVRTEVAAAKRALEEATAADSMLRIQLEGAAEEKSHLQGIIGNRSAEVERLTAERDYYFRCLDEKTEELSLLKAEKQRLIVQLEDKMADMGSLHADRRVELQQGAEGLLAAKDRQLEDLVRGREQLLRKLKNREKATREMEIEKERLRTEAMHARSESEAVLRERSQLYEELRESRKEALQLGTELEKLRAGGSDRELELQQKVQELTSRFHSIEEEVRAGKTKTPAKGRIGGRLLRESPGGTAKAQLDGVKVRLRELEGRTASVEAERKRLKAENDRLCRLLQRVTGQNEKLSGELEYYVTKSQELRDQLAVVEAERERLAQDFEEARAQVEALEAEASRSKGQAVGLARRLDALRRASAGVVAKVGGPEENGDMRSMLADVRAILTSHARPPAGDQRSGSPVHSLLLERSAQ